MIAALMGVPGKLKTLLDRLTSTRAGNLDNLDAAVTTRAAASTALSTSQWTNTLATDLGTISSGASAFTGIINRIQYGAVSLSAASSATATVTSVNTAKSVLVYLGATVNGTAAAAASDNWFCRLTLTNATTVTAYRVGSTGICIVSFCLVEFK